MITDKPAVCAFSTRALKLWTSAKTLAKAVLWYSKGIAR